MKKLIIYAVGFLLISGATSCKKQVLDNPDPGQDGVSLFASDMGYYVQGDTPSKAVEEGYKTVFQPKDAIGMFAIDVKDPDNAVIIAGFDNVKFVLQGDGTTWKPEADQFLVQRENVKFIFYYPYNARYAGSKDYADIKTKHYAWVNSLGADKLKMKDYAQYTARDLMIAQGDGATADVALPGDVKYDLVRDVFTVKLQHMMSGIELRFVSFYEGSTPATRTTTIEPDSIVSLKIGKPETAKDECVFYNIQAGVYRLLTIPNEVAGSEIEADATYIDGAGTRKYQSVKFLQEENTFTVHKPWQKVEIVEVDSVVNTFIMQPKADRAMLYRLKGAITRAQQFWGPGSQGWGRIFEGNQLTELYIRDTARWMAAIEWMNFAQTYTDELDGLTKNRITIKQSEFVKDILPTSSYYRSIVGLRRMGVGKDEPLCVQLAAGSYSGAAVVSVRGQSMNTPANLNLYTWSFNLWIPEQGVDPTQVVTAKMKSDLNIMPVSVGAKNEFDPSGPVFQWGSPRMLPLGANDIKYAEGYLRSKTTNNSVFTMRHALILSLFRTGVPASVFADCFEASSSTSGSALNLSGQFGHNRWGGYNFPLGASQVFQTANGVATNLIAQKTIFDPCPAGYRVAGGATAAQLLGGTGTPAENGWTAVTNYKGSGKDGYTLEGTNGKLFFGSIANYISTDGSLITTGAVHNIGAVVSRDASISFMNNASMFSLGSSKLGGFQLRCVKGM